MGLKLHSPHVAATLFLALSFYWFLPGHYEVPAFHSALIGVYTLFVVSVLWLLCFVLPWRQAHISYAPYLLAISAALLSLIPNSFTASNEQGLAARYYDNANFSGNIEKSIPVQSTEYTRTEPVINFTSRGFSFFEQYFLLAFANDASRRQWSADKDTSTENYPFSVEFNGYITIPQRVTELRLIADGGSAQMLLDGKPVAADSAAAVVSGTYAIAVRYVRNQSSKPSLKLLWRDAGKEKPIPTDAFTKIKQPPESPATLLKGVSLAIWLAAIVAALKQIQPAFVLHKRTYYWFLFIGLLLFSVFDLQKDGRHFDYQIFRVGNDWLYYESFARAILQGDWLSKQEGDLIFLNFAYRYILALLHWLAGEAPANAMLLQRALMAACIAFAVYAIDKLYGARTAIFLAITTIACEQFAEFATSLLDTVFAISLSFALLYCLIQYSRGHARAWIVTASVLFGLSLLVRANFLPFVLVVPLWIYFFTAPNRATSLAKDISIFVVGALLIFSLIAVRNYLVSERWVFLPTNGPFNLWLGNHPSEFDGPTYFSARVPPMPEIVGRVIDYSLSDPIAFAKRMWEKALYIFGVDNKALYSFGFGAIKKSRFHADIGLPWLIAGLGSISLWRNRSIRPELVLLWIWILLVNAPLLIFFPWGYGWRLSAPSFLPLYVICALSIANWSQKIMPERARQNRLHPY